MESKKNSKKGEEVMASIKTILHGCKQCGMFRFFKYNFFNKCIVRKDDCYFYPIKGSVLKMSPSSKLILNGNLFFNAGKYNGSKTESYLVLDRNSVLTINNYTRVNYNSTIHVNDNAELCIGSLTTNVGINIQVKKKVIIGEDCMFGRGTTVFDSTFHPTGASSKSMKTNTSEVEIGDHVWIGAYSFVSEGTHIGDGSMIGSCACVSGNVGEATTVVRQHDSPAMVGYMWARSEDSNELNKAFGYYATNEKNSIIDKKAVAELKNPITAIVNELFPAIDFNASYNLVSDHVLDSLSLIKTVRVLEERFQITIPFYEISPVNFDSIDLMASLVFRLRLGKSNVDMLRKNRQYPAHNDEYIVPSQNTLIEYVKLHAEKNPDKIAVFSEGGFFTYETLYDFAQKYASFLISKGLQRGDRVVVKSSQSVHYIIIYLAVHYAGGVITTLEKTSPNTKILEIAKIVDAKIVVCNDGALLNDFIFVNSNTVMDDLMTVDKISIHFPQSYDSADILFTTGTTGESKGVELSHSAVIAGAENIAYGCQMRKNTVLVVPNPLSHSNAIKNMGSCFITGCSFYILDGMTDLKAFFDALDCDYGKVATVLPPAAIRTLFQMAKEKLAEYRDKLDYLMAAMAPLLEPDRDALRNLLPKTRLYNHYGCSESSSICIYDFNKYSDLKNCVGKAMPHSRVFFVDENKNEISSSLSNLGLLAVEGDATMKGYYNAPELTETIKNGNIIYTKDVGYMDEEGFVYVLGRDDDVINVGGLKVSPLEVEAAASSYEGVADCICIGIDDEISGQALKLLVVAGMNFDMIALKSILSEKLQGYKNPGDIELVEKVERTFNGKLNRKAYRNG